MPRAEVRVMVWQEGSIRQAGTLMSIRISRITKISNIQQATNSKVSTNRCTEGDSIDIVLPIPILFYDMVCTGSAQPYHQTQSNT